MPARLLMAAILMTFSGFVCAQFDDNYLGGTTQPASSNIQQGSTQNQALSFGILRPLSSFGDTCTGITVRNQAASNAAGMNDFDQLQLWRDVNQDDIFQPGTDTIVASATSANFPVSFSGFSQSIPAGGAEGFFVTIDVSSGATVGAQFLLEVTIADVSMTTYPIQSATQAIGTTQTVTGSTPTQDQIVVAQDPAGASPNTAFTTQPQVELRNSGGTLLSGNNSTVVTVSITAGTGTSGAVLGPSGSLTATASGGVVDFTGLMIDLVGIDYQLTFTATGFTSANSAQFDVGTVQTATQLFITTQPANGTTSQPFATHPVVEIRDATNTLVPNATHFVTVTKNGGTGTLQGTLIVQAVNGVATFNNLFIDAPGTYTLTFSAVNLASDISTSFQISDPGSSGGGGSGGGGDDGGGCVLAETPTTILILGVLAVAISLRRRRQTA